MEFLIKDDVLDNVCWHCKGMGKTIITCLTEEATAYLTKENCKEKCNVYKAINRTKTYELDPTIYLNADGCKDCLHESKDIGQAPCNECKNSYLNKWTPKPPKEICENCENWNKIEEGKGTCDKFNETIVDADFYCKHFTGKGIYKWIRKEEL